MRKIIASTYTTVDGFIDDPHLWSLPYIGEQAQDYALQMTLGADALLLGRVTWQGMAEAWPAMASDPFSDHVNAIAKYVVASEAVDTTSWGPTDVIPGRTRRPGEPAQGPARPGHPHLGPRASDRHPHRRRAPGRAPPVAHPGRQGQRRTAVPTPERRCPRADRQHHLRHRLDRPHLPGPPSRLTVTDMEGVRVNGRASP